MWKKGIAVLSAGKTLVSPDSRVTLNPDYSLEIKEVGPQDAGDYVCQIGTLQPKEITHTVEILGKFYILLHTFISKRYYFGNLTRF